MRIDRRPAFGQGVERAADAPAAHGGRIRGSAVGDEDREDRDDKEQAARDV